jgi:hypothetical protein
MNKSVRPPFPPPRPDSYLAKLKRTVRRYIGAQNAKENAGAELKSQYLRDNPRYYQTQLLVVEFTKRQSLLEAERDRIANVKSLNDPLVTEDQGPVKEARSSFQHAKFILFNTGTAIGVVMGMHALASYVSSSDAVPMLYGHYWSALVMSGIPISGVLAIEGRAALAENEAEERAYYKTLFVLGGISLAICVATVSNVFAPKNIDLAALAQNLADDVPIDGWFDSLLKNVGDRVALGSQLFTEILLAPVIAHAADLIYRSGRILVPRVSDKQDALDKIIASINQRIDAGMEQLAHAQAELDLHTEEMRAFIEKGQYLLAQVETEIDTNKRRVHDDTMNRFGGV